jgi:tRNA modification GTPase
MHSVQGEFSKHIHTLVHQLIQLRTYIEACLDFSEEDIDFLSDKMVEKSLAELLVSLRKTIQSTRQGVLLQEGMRIVITGKPNAGKSSLLNALSGRECAIVADIAGTTRDVLREFIHLDGMPLHIIDTAGLHESDHVIEKEAMRRALQEIQLADHVLFIQDITSASTDDDFLALPNEATEILHTKPMTIINNKIDLINKSPTLIHENNKTIIYLSAKHKTGIDLLSNHLKKYMGFDIGEEGLFIARRRHLDALKSAQQYISRAYAQLENNTPEILAEELRLAQLDLSKITGEFTTEDLLSEIFSKFCIGK